MRYEIDTRQLDELRQRFQGFSNRRFNAGLATALTRTAAAVRQAQQAEIRDVFDRPTPRTLGAIYLQAAKADNLQAAVGVATEEFSGNAPIKWLRWQIGGGLRTAKGFERRLISAGAMPSDMLAVPGRFARLDAFGNISAGQIRQILSQLRIEPFSGATSALPRIGVGDKRLLANARRGSGFVGPISGSAVKDARARINRVQSAYRRAGGQFVAFPNGRGKLKPGVYQVRSTAWGRSDPRPVLVYVTRAQYEAGLYDFDYVSQLAIQRNLGPNIQAATTDQLRRFAAKYGTGA